MLLSDKTKGRLEAFSDGVFATAVILQVVTTMVGVFRPVVAAVVYPELSVFFFVDPLWIERVRRRARRPSGVWGGLRRGSVG